MNKVRIFIIIFYIISLKPFGIQLYNVILIKYDVAIFIRHYRFNMMNREYINEISLLTFIFI
jgi:hypothetical protein